MGLLKAGRSGALVVDGSLHVLEPNWNPSTGDGDDLEGLAASWGRQVRWFYGPKTDPGYLAQSIADCWTGSGDKLIARMDAAGVDVSILLPMDHSCFPDDRVIPIREQNRLAREVGRRHSGRVYSFAAVDPRRPDALEILRESLDDGSLGLRLYPTDGFYPDDEVCTPLYELCAERGAPVVFHTGHSSGRQKSKYGHPMMFDAVAADFPELRLVMGHSGRFEAWSREAFAVAIYKTNTYLDISLWQHFISPDELVRQLVWGPRDRVGLDRVLFGSDLIGIDTSLDLGSGFDLVASMPEWANQLGYRLLPEEIDLVLGENCRRLYGIPDEALAVRDARPAAAR